MNFRVAVAFAAGLLLAAAFAAEPENRPHEVVINLDELPPPSPAKPTTAKSPTTPNRSSAPGQPAAAKKDDKGAKQKGPPSEVKGFELARSGHGYLGLQVVDNTFRVTFYDKDKKPTPPDVSSIALRWPVQYQPNPERTVLTPAGDGSYMTSEKTVRPPFHFRLYVTLLKTDDSGRDQVVESYVVEFSQ